MEIFYVSRVRRRRKFFRKSLLSSLVAASAALLLFADVASAVNSATSTMSGNGTGGLSPRSKPCDTWVLNGISAGTSVSLYMYKVSMSDPYLHVFDSTGRQIAANDDGAGNLNSLITTTWQTGYYVGASVYGSNNGSYYLGSSLGSSWTRISSSCAGAPAKLNQTITFNNPGTRTFGTSFTLSASATSGLAVTFSSSTPSICSVSGTTASMLAAGTCTISANQAGNATYNAASTVTQSFTVAKASQTITFGTPANQTFSPTNTVSMSASSSSGLAVAFASQTTAICTTGGTNGATVTMVAAGTCTVRASQAGNANYLAATSVDRSFTISKASQSITFSTLSDRTYSRTSFTVSGTTSASGLNVSFASQTTGVCSTSGTSGTTVTMLGLGTCTIRASQVGDSRYLAALDVDRSFTVSKASQTISFTTSGVAAQTYGNAAFTVSGTATGTTTSGVALVVTFTSSTPNVCSTGGTNGTSVSINGAGTCTIVASQSGNDVFLAAPTVSQSVEIARKTLTAPNASVVSRTYNGGRLAGTIVVGALSGLVGSETLNVTATGSDYLVSTVGSRQTTVTFTLANGSNGGLASNYQISTALLTGQVTQRPLTVTADAFSKTADAVAPSFSVQAEGLVPGETVSSATYTFSGTGATTYGPSTTAPPATTVGTYSIQPSVLVLAGEAAAANYSITYINSSYVITHGEAKKLTAPSFSGTRVSGVAFGVQPVITIRDNGNNVITTGAASIANVTASITSGINGDLVGTLTVQAVDGIATFSNLGLEGLVSQTYTISYSVSELTSATQSVTPTFGAATQLAVVNTVSAQVATAFSTQPHVEVQDAKGNRVTSSTARITAAVSGAALSGNTSVSAVSGLAQFTNLSMVGAVATDYDLTFSSAGLSGTNQIVVLQAGPAAQLDLTTRAAGTAAGSNFTTPPAVTIRDAGGNPVLVAGSTVTATISRVDGVGDLVVNGASPATTKTATTNASGVATFTNLGISGLNATTYRLTFSSTVNAVSLTTVIQDITVTTGPATQIVLDTPASGAASGAAVTVQPQVRILDLAGNLVTAEAAQKTITATTSVGTLSNESVETVAGYARFSNFTLTGTVGTATITFESGSLAAASQSLTLVAGAPSKLKVERSAADARAGAVLATQPRVEIVDAQDNRVLTSSFVVTASLVDGDRSLIGNVTATAVSGLATFQGLGVAGTIGNFDLLFDAGLLPTLTHSTLTLAHGAATKIAIETAASGARAGAAFDVQPEVELRDAYNNIVTSGASATSYVTAAVSTGATIVGTSTQQLVSGSLTFSGLGITGRNGTAYTLTFTSTNGLAVSNNLSVASQTITGGVGAATSLALTQSAVGTASGAMFSSQPMVTIRDVFGNTVTASAATVRARITAGSGGNLTGTSTAATSSGLAAFTGLGITGTAGTAYTITYDVEASAGLGSVTQVVRVTPGVASALEIVRQPSATVAAGVALATQPQLAIVDAQGNIVTSSSALVTATKASGSGTLGGTKAVNAVSGVVTFDNLAFSGSVGNYALSFALNESISATSNSVTLTPGAANKVVVTNKGLVTDGSALSGAALGVQPQVVIHDAWGNTVTSGAGATATISAAASDGATLNAGSSTSTTDGVRTFSGLGLKARSGTHTITYRATVDGVVMAPDSHTVAVTPGAPALLNLAKPAVGTASGAVFTAQPELRVLDSAGNLVSSSTAEISASISPVSGGFVGDTTVNAVGGVATFDGLGMTGTAGTSYTITFAAGALTATQTLTATHGAINIAQTGLTASVIDDQVVSDSVRSDVTFTSQPKITIRDAQSNVVTSSSDEVTVSVARKTGSGSDLAGRLTGITTVRAVSGIAQFSGLSLSGTAGVQYTLTFKLGADTLATQDVTVVAGPAVRLSLDTAGNGARAAVALTTQPVISLRDASGNTATTSGVSVAAAVSAGGTITGATATTNASGVATFSGLTVAGRTSTYSVTYTATGLGSVSQNLTLGVGDAARIRVDPAVKEIVVESGVSFDLGTGVRIVDSSENTVITDSVAVTTSANAELVKINGEPVSTLSQMVINKTSTNDLAGTNSYNGNKGVVPTSTSCDTSTVSNIDWNAVGGGLAGCNIDDFQVYYSGTIVGPATGLVTFYSNTDDGFYMTIDGNTVIDDWETQGAATWPAYNAMILPNTGTFQMEKGRAYQFKAWFFERGGGAQATLRWSMPGAAASTGVVVPATAFKSVTSNTMNGVVQTTQFEGTVGDYTVVYGAPGLISDTQIVKLGSGVARQLQVATPGSGARAGSAFVEQTEVAVRDSVGNLVVGNTSTVRSFIVTKPSGEPAFVGSPSTAAVDGVARSTNLGIAGPTGSYLVGITSAVQKDSLLVHLDAGLSYSGTGTNWRDLSGKGNNATLVNSPTYTAPTPNSQASIAFNKGGDASSDGYATLPSGFSDFRAGLTIQATVDFGTANTYERIIDMGLGELSGNILMGRDAATSRLFFEFHAGPDNSQSVGRCVSPDNTIEAGYHNYAVTLAQSTVNGPTVCKMFKNGVSISTTWPVVTVMPPVITRTSNLIGKSNWPYDASLREGMRNILVYNTALTADEVLANSLNNDYYNVTLAAGEASKLSLVNDSAALTIAAGANAGAAFTTQPVVRLRDASGNLAVTGSGLVDVALVATLSGETCAAPSGATLSGNTSVSAVSGVATFAGLSLTGAAGTYCLEYTSGALTVATQTLTLAPGAPVRLSVTAPGANAAVGTAAGSVFTSVPKVAVLDASGNVVTTSSASVTMTLTSVDSNGTSSGVLVGGTNNAKSVNASSGIATFAGTGITGTTNVTYQVTYSATDLASVSQNITVTTGPAAKLVLTRQASTMRVGLPLAIQPVVEVRDAGDNVVQTNSTVVRATVSTSVENASGSLSSNSQQTTVGVASFSGTAFMGTAATSGTIYTVTYEAMDGENVDATIAATAQTITARPGLATGLSLARGAGNQKSGSAFTNQPTVSLVDISNNPVDGIAAIVTAALDCTNGPLDCASASLVGNAGQPLVNGQAVFTNVGLSAKVGTYTLKYSATIEGSARTVEGNVVIVGGDPVRIDLTSATGTAVGAAFTSQPSVAFFDAIGNTATVPVGTKVRAAIDAITINGASTGSLTGTTDVTVTSGVASFNNLAPIGVAGQTYRISYTPIDADEDVLAGFTTLEQSVMLTAGAPTSMTITTNPGGATSGAALLSQPQIELRDAGGNGAASGSVTVSVSSAPAGQTTEALSGTLTASTTNGVAVFTDLMLTGKVGNYDLTFTPTNGMATQTVEVALGAGVPTQLRIRTAPIADVTGTAFTTQPVLAVTDAQDNVVISQSPSVSAAITSGDNGRLVGTTRAIASAGVATFSDLGIAGRTTQTYALTFSAVVGNTTFTATQDNITVLAGPAASLELTAAATDVVTDGLVVAQSGKAFVDHSAGAAPVVTLYDAGGNVVITSTAEVTASVSVGASLVGAAAVNATNGIATFTDLGINGINGATYTVSYSVTGLPQVSQRITAATGAATQLTNEVIVSGASSGAAVTTAPAVRLRDSAGNPVSTSGVTVNVAASSDATLSGVMSVATNIDGAATFDGLIVTGIMGTRYTLTFSASGLTATTQDVVVELGAPSQVGFVIEPVGTASGAAFTTQPVLVVQDGGGNTVASSNATVTATVTQVSGTGSVVGTTAVNAVGGIARFADLGITGTAGTTYSINFGGLNLSAVSKSITVTTGAAVGLVVSNVSVPDARSGLPFDDDISVRVVDTGGNTVTSSTDVITASISGGSGAVLVGNTNATAVAGVATFTDLGLSGTAGQQPTISFSLAGTTPALMVPTVSAGPAARLSLNGYTDQAAPSGSAFNEDPVIRIEDSGGNLISTGTASTINVTATISQLSVGGSLTGQLVGDTTVAAMGGVATFGNLGITGVAGRSYTVTYSASVGGTDLTSVSEQFTVSVGPAVALDLSTPSIGTASGAVFARQPVLTVRDTGGNVVSGQTGAVHAAISSGGELEGRTSQTLVSGAADFDGTDLGITGTAGSTYTITYDLRIAGVSIASVASTTQDVTVTVGAAKKLALTQPAAGASSGTSFSTQPIVTIQDSGGNTVTSSTAAIAATVAQVSVGGVQTGSLSGIDVVDAVDGVASYTNLALSGRTTASYVITYTAAALPSATRTITQTLTPASGSASSLRIVSSAEGAAAGAMFTNQPSIEILDAAGNRALTSSARVTIDVNDGVLTGSTFVDATAGLASFTGVGLTGTAGQNYTLSYASSGLVGTAQTISALVGNPTRVVLTRDSVGTKAGAAFTTQPILELLDAGNNLVSSGSGSSLVVTANISIINVGGDLTGELVGTTTATANSGVATFSNLGLGGRTGVAYTISYGASFTGSALTPATQSVIPTPGDFSAVAIQLEADGAVVGQAFTTQPRVTVRDRFGNNVTEGSSTVNVSISSGATLIGSTARTTVNGVAVFTNLGARGTSGTSYTLSFALPDGEPTTQSIDLRAGAASRLVVSRSSEGATAGAVLRTTPQIQVKDIDGNLVATSTAAVTATVNQVDGTGTLAGASSSAVNGTASFSNLALTGRAGTAYVIEYSALGLLPATETVTLELGTPSSLELVTRSVGTATGRAFVQQPRLVIKDPGGNLITTSSAPVTATIAPVAGGEGGSLVGTTQVNAVEGVATFTNLGLSGNAGTAYRISYSIDGVQAATQDVTAAIGDPVALDLTTESVGTTADAEFTTQPRVTVRDSAGNAVTSSSASVTARISVGGRLLGTTTVNAINGVARFINLGVDGVVGDSYVVTYSSGSLTPVTQSLRLTAAEAGLTPVFDVPFSTTDGFRVNITNHDADFSFSGTSNVGGRVTISESGVVTVGGLAPYSLSTVTVTARRAGHVTESRTVSARAAIGPALVAQFGSPVATATGFTVQISNFNSAYVWRATSSAGGTATVNSTGRITVAGLGGGVTSNVTVETTRAGHTSAIATSADSTTLLAGLRPEFGVPTRIINGFTVQITNYDASYTWDGSATSGATATINSSGLITVGNLADGVRAGVLVTTTQAGYTSQSATVEGQALSRAYEPSLLVPVMTNGGWTVGIANFDPLFTWSVSTSQGTATLNSVTGVITVTGVSTAATVTVDARRVGFLQGQSTTMIILQSGLTPLFEPATVNDDGFTVEISNYSTDYTWRVSTSSGVASISETGLVTVVASGTATVTVTTSRIGYSEQSSSYTYGATPGLTPTFGAVTPTNDGFTIPVANYDPSYLWTVSVTAGANVLFDEDSEIVTVSGLPRGLSSVVTLATNKNGHSTGIAQQLGTAIPEAALTPILSAPTPTSNGFMAQVQNYEPAWIWEVSASGGAEAEISPTGEITVLQMVPGESADLTVRTRRSLYADGAETLRGTSLPGGGLLALFDPHVATADGFTVRVRNYDSAYAWTVTASSGTVTISDQGIVTVVGLASDATSTVTVRATRSGRADGVSTFLGGALSSDGVTPALLNGRAPTFGQPARMSDGFRVQILNYSGSLWTWSALSSRSATTTISSTGLMTVTGLDPNQNDTVVVQTARSGYATGAASVTSSSLGAGRRADNLLTDLTLRAVCPHGSPELEGVTGVNDLSVAEKFSCYTGANKAVAPYVANSIGFSTPDIGNFIVTGVAFSPATHSPERDPLTYTLWGCALENQFCSVIVNNDITGLSLNRGIDGVRSIRNSRPFNFYRLAFGSLRGEANMVQIGEVSFTGISGLRDGLTPTLGTPDATATGFTVQVTNFSNLYNWQLSVPAPARAVISDTGLIRVSNLLPQSETALTVSTSRNGYADAVATVTTTTRSGAALVPVISSVAATTDGLTALIENYDTPGYTWEVESTVNGAATGAGEVEIADSGVVTISNATPGATVRLAVTTSRLNHLSSSSFVESQVLRDGGALEFTSPVRTNDGFRVSIVEFAQFDDFDFAVSVSRGASAILNELTGEVTVSNLGVGAGAIVTVERTRDGYSSASRSQLAFSVSPARVPVFELPALSDTGFTVGISNFDPAWNWTVATSVGTASLDLDTGVVTVTHDEGDSPVVTVTTTRDGHATGTAATGTELFAALTPELGVAVTSGTGFTVNIENYDSTWTWSARVSPLGSVSISNSGVVTVVGSALGDTTTLTVNSARPSYIIGEAETTHTRPALSGLVPTFASPTPLVGAFTVQISNYDPLFTWTTTAPAGVTATITTDGVLSVSGASTATPTEVTVATSRTGHLTGSATVSATARPDIARIPTFGAVSPTSDGFTAQITNFDPAWQWTASADSNSRVLVGSDGQLTVFGAPGFTLVSVSVTSTRDGYNPGVAVVRATTVVADALIPSMSISLSTAVGFSVPIRNYDPLWDWTVSSNIDNVDGFVSADGVVNVSGVAPGTVATVTVTTSRIGYLSGSAEFSAVATPRRNVALVPTAITIVTRASEVATLTTEEAHGFTAGDRIIVSGAGIGFDGEIQIADVPTDSTFTYTSLGDDVAQTLLSPSGFAQPANDVPMLVTFTPDSAENPIQAVINVPFAAGEDGTVFEGIPAMTEDAEAGYGMVRIDAVGPNGADITRLNAAIRILFPSPAPGAIPVSSSDDGLTWDVLPLLEFPELPADMSDGYYVNPDGTVWIFTRHLSMFGLLAEQEIPLEVTASESILRPGDNAQVVVTGGVGDGDLDVVTTTDSVCSLDENLVVTALADGVCFIRATKGSFGRYLSASSTLEVDVRTPVPPLPDIDDPASGDVGDDTSGPSVQNPITDVPLPTEKPSSGALPPGTNIPSTPAKKPTTVADEERPVTPGAGSPVVDKTRPVLVIEGDKTVNTSVTIGSSGGSIVVRGDDFSVELGGLDAQGRRLLLDEFSRPQVLRGQGLQFAGTGYAPNSKVTMWIFDGKKSIKIGSVTTDANGNFSDTFLIPDDLLNGEYTVQMRGLSVSGDVRTLNASIVVVEKADIVKPDDTERVDQSESSSRGFGISPMQIVFLLLALIILAGLAAFGRRRRARK